MLKKFDVGDLVVMDPDERKNNAVFTRKLGNTVYEVIVAKPTSNLITVRPVDSHDARDTKQYFCWRFMKYEDVDVTQVL